MTIYERTSFTQLFDRDSANLFEDHLFKECVFNNCALSLTKSPQLRSTVRNVRILDCTSLSCDIGPAVFDNVIVAGLRTNDLLIVWGALFKHVTLSGNCGKLKINKAAHFVDRTAEIQEPFATARDSFYRNVDWALDISEARFQEFDMHGVPARLVRRDATSQAVVTREKAIQQDWRSRISRFNTYWPYVIDMFLESGDSDIVLVAPKAKPKQEVMQLVDGLEDLRQAGVAEPN